MQFWYGYDVITFIYKPECIGIHINHKSDEELHEVCSGIRELVKITLGSVSASMFKSLYTSTSEERYKCHFENYQFAFKCYEHSDHDHLCVVSNEEMPKIMKCVWDEDNTPLKITPEHLIWYGEVCLHDLLYTCSLL